ncbi:hypothetical protein SDC9_132841 [bioreactor metagenome]|uniref:Uncharacterized protein n=1 Tax=bioreactor metagenome TaxID=1076179 RepID=A0A645D8A8_9ZZZZ
MFSKIDRITRVQTYQPVIITHLFPEIGKEFLKNIGHPVKGWAHIKTESFTFKDSGPAACNVEFFVYRDFKALFCKITSG